MTRRVMAVQRIVKAQKSRLTTTASVEAVGGRNGMANKASMSVGRRGHGGIDGGSSPGGQELHGALDRDADDAAALIDPLVDAQVGVLALAQLFQGERRVAPVAGGCELSLNGGRRRGVGAPARARGAEGGPHAPDGEVDD